MKRNIQAAFFCNGIPWTGGDGIDYVYAGGRRQQVGEMTSLHPVVITRNNFDAEGLGVVRVTLEEAFAQSVVVSNHLPDLPDLVRVLDGRLFASMRPNATFINTGRGRQVNEPELIAVLRERLDLMALLDVTDPALCTPDSELYRLPNVQLSSHMAGAHDDEVIRMADTVIEEFTRWQNGDPLRFSVTREQLARMA